MRWKKKILLVLGVLFILIQFFPTKRNQSTQILSSDFILIYDVPENMVSKIKISCYDCHSNNTYYPWYNKIQPVSWFLENHIAEAKEELNFSEFGNYSKRRKKSKLKSIVSQIEDGEMPLPSYTLMHKDARLSDEDMTNIISWFENIEVK